MQQSEYNARLGTYGRPHELRQMSYRIQTPEDMADLIREWGIVPFFTNPIPGFSIEENVRPDLWFSDTVDGPWEWKGPVIRMLDCAYGKFFRGKAVYMTREWFLDYANYRRDGYDLDARYDDGLLQNRDKVVYEALDGQGPILSKEWYRRSGVEKRGQFDSIITRLQMMGYVTTNNFEYAKDKYGNTYGWGIARYTTPEQQWGDAFRQQVYRREPEESRDRMIAHIHSLFPEVEDKVIRRLIR